MVLLPLLALGAAACFEAPCEVATEPGAPPRPCPAFDAGARPVDGGRDAGAVDAGRSDAGRPDSGAPLDAGLPLDAGPPDAGLEFGDAGLRVVDLGIVTTAADGGPSELLSLRVEPTDEGFQLEVLQLDAGPDAFVVFQVDRLRNPLGVELAAGIDTGQHLSRSSPSINHAAALVLESDDFRRFWVSGTWTFRVASYDSDRVPLGGARASVRAFIKPRTRPGTQRLGVNLFFTGGAGLTSASQASQPRFQRALVGFREIFRDAGIELDAPRTFDLPMPFSRITSYVDLDGGFPGRSVQSLFRQSRDAPSGVNIFFVESLSPDPSIPSGLLLGLASGAPGLTMTPGTSGSGVVVLFDSPTFVPMPPVTADWLPSTIAHEVGHQLGLSHVYELRGTLDNLSDTPEEGVPAAEDNLMAPTAQTEGSRLSPLQVVTLRRNPVVRP